MGSRGRQRLGGHSGARERPRAPGQSPGGGRQPGRPACGGNMPASPDRERGQRRRQEAVRGVGASGGVSAEVCAQSHPRVMPKRPAVSGLRVLGGFGK